MVALITTEEPSCSKTIPFPATNSKLSLVLEGDSVKLSPLFTNDTEVYRFGVSILTDEPSVSNPKTKLSLSMLNVSVGLLAVTDSLLFKRTVLKTSCAPAASTTRISISSFVVKLN